ncbi:hypothetical protein LOTGIDRAFT_160263 [Lottia gigantea]|uniref:G-protein coupled receptors family 1 profile domain-containing protein n=1 Tax=Lottia gigantea TaxID=225164 RepID=V3ZW20_LOTGI|nr:hypothetical protein LOTGIDRAFT_160263 [Lottia gigantea]ESO95713.1 hypothetical protein LOTGIDRAFT_160263 [Lottia gigantea]
MATVNDTVPEDGPIDAAQLHAVIGILSIFAVFGTIGNALAFYVFYNLKQKLTSTIFILTLAGTDFITCLVTIPFTITLESVEFVVDDAVCKIYHFLITTTIPFSAFVMVAIAFDRYLCICHPFLHVMTIRRAKIIVASLSVLSLSLGIIACIHYTTWVLQDLEVDDLLTTSKPFLDPDVTVEDFSDSSSVVHYSSYPTGYTHRQNSSAAASTLTLSVNVSTTPTPVKTIKAFIDKGQCRTNEHVINSVFFMVYQKIYSALFLVCCLIVLALYSLIYRFVISQREKRLQIKSNNCCWPVTNTENSSIECEQSEATVALELSQTNGDKLKNKCESTHVENNTANGINSNMSRTRLEKMRMANIKTAFMLFIVTLVFIIAFLPAWLMAHKLVYKFVSEVNN